MSEKEKSEDRPLIVPKSKQPAPEPAPDAPKPDATGPWGRDVKE